MLPNNDQAQSDKYDFISGQHGGYYRYDLTDHAYLYNPRNAYQNYPLLKGQVANLYKAILENGLNMISPNGFLGLLHPEGVYDDNNGQELRKKIYRHLKFHFQFQNL